MNVLTHLHGSGWQEQPLQFGDGGRLMGVFCSPTDRPMRQVACLLLNTGVGQRIGPHRLNVKLARQLAASLGIASLRMDLSGLGDSRNAASSKPFKEQGIDDQRHGLDWLSRTHGISQVVVFGVCSGAFNGFELARADERVIGVSLYDGYTYPSAGALRRYRYLKLQQHPVWQWPAVLARRALRRLSTAAPADDAEVSMPAERSESRVLAGDADRSKPTAQGYAQALDALDARGCAIDLMTSSSFLYLFNGPQQYSELFGGHAFMQRAQTAYFEDIDHIVTTLAAQQHMCERVCAWADQVLAARKL